MRNRFAVPTLATLERYRSERDVAFRQARKLYDNHGDSRAVLNLIATARGWSRKVVWARRYLGLHRATGT